MCQKTRERLKLQTQTAEQVQFSDFYETQKHTGFTEGEQWQAEVQTKRIGPTRQSNPQKGRGKESTDQTTVRQK